tara:strand:- start:81 stop:674 length:594 start_codon:yes stop_codon:yes gene_type:complete
MEVIGLYNKRKFEKGITLLEALVSTAIIGIGFVAIFQMVNYSVQSIDVSGERTKSNYLVGMVAEDLISEKHSNSPSKDIKFMDYLVSNKVSGTSSWRMGSCSTGTSTSGSFTNAAQNKFKKWDDRFSTRRIKCKGNQDIKFLKIFDICNNSASGNNCKYNNNQRYDGTGVYDKWYLGKMEVNMNDGGKKKYLYFQIH